MRSRSHVTNRYLLAGVIVAGLALRLAGLAWGLPDATHIRTFHPDEFVIVLPVLGMLITGSLHPGDFTYGAFTKYLLYVLNRPETGFTSIVGDLYLSARLLTVAFGVGAVYLTFLLGRRLHGERLGILAALFLALSPGNVLHSHFATVDVPSTFLITLALLLAVRILENPSMLLCLAAGVVAGLALGTKYNAGLVLLSPVLAVLMSRGSRANAAATSGRLMMMGCSTLACFVLSNPYAVLDSPAFWDDFWPAVFQYHRMGWGNLFENTGNGWWFHLTRNFPYLLGPPLAILAVAGIVPAARSRDPKWYVLLGFALPYFFLIGLSKIRFMRYDLPLTPVLALAAAYLLCRPVQFSPRFPAVSRMAGGLRRPLAFIALIWAGCLSVAQDFALVKVDPRAQAASWIREHLAPTNSVGLLNIPWYYTPPITPINGGQGTRERFEQEVAAGRVGYRLVLCEGWDVRKLLQEQPDYVVFSELESREFVRLEDPLALRFLSCLDQNYTLVSTFNTFPPKARWAFGRPFAPVDWLIAYPEVRIYQRKGT